MGFLALTMLLGLMFASVAYSEIQCNTAPDRFDCREFHNLTHPFWKNSTYQETCSNGEFKLLNCDSKTELVSVLIKDQTFRVENISLEKKTMTLSLPFDNHCVIANMSHVPLPHIFQPTSIIFFGCDPGKGAPEFGNLQCVSDEWIYWGSEMYPTPLYILESCKIQFVLMNGTTLDGIRSSTNWQGLRDKLLTAIKNGFEVPFTMPQCCSRDIW